MRLSDKAKAGDADEWAVPMVVAFVLLLGSAALAEFGLYFVAVAVFLLAALAFTGAIIVGVAAAADS